VLLVPKRAFGVPPMNSLLLLPAAADGHQLQAREDYCLQGDSLPKPLVHRSRVQLMDRLWSWLVLEPDQPRPFLYGPGGSGKSTLAYEFARLPSKQLSSSLFPEETR
jgi:pantothenate kinase-related protein Tda10